jgi:hypothetical protein
VSTSGTVASATAAIGGRFPYIRGGIVALDIILGLVPVVVDAATGGWWTLRPQDTSVTLTRTTTSTDQPETIRVALES